MAVIGGPDVVTDGLVLCLDAANPKSYPGSGTAWNDLSGNNFDFTIDDTGLTHNSGGWFDMAGGGATRSGAVTANTTCTVVYWMRTNDASALFLSGPTTNGNYLGAYSSGNKFYSGGFGSPSLFMNGSSIANLYDNIRTDEWMMIEFKSANMQNITNLHFNQYSSFTFTAGDIAIIKIYDRNLTTAESLQNYNALKDRFE
jgi:hypothetical protein